MVTTISGTVASFAYTVKATGASATGGATTQVQQANPTTGFTNAGTYPTDGVRGISINSANNLSISFSNALAAFGYFGTDLGDAGNTLTMNFYNGATLLSSTPVTTGTGSANSSEFFFGFIADTPAQEFNRVDFISSLSTGGDAIGIDQIKIATPAQKKVPEPSAILGTLLFGGCVVALKRRHQQARSTKR